MTDKILEVPCWYPLSFLNHQEIRHYQEIPGGAAHAPHPHPSGVPIKFVWKSTR